MTDADPSHSNSSDEAIEIPPWGAPRAIAEINPTPPVRQTEVAHDASVSEESFHQTARPIVARGKGFDLELDPFQCSPFEGSPRAGHIFCDARDGELAADILANGVLEPVTVWNDGKIDRLIAGNRRLAVVIHLRELGHQIALPARLAKVTASEAIAIAHSSNNGRERPTAMEQAKAVAWTIGNLGIDQAEVGKLLRFDEAKVSRLLVLANLPPWVLECATDSNTLSELFAGNIQAALQNPQQCKTMEARAAHLQRENRTLSGAPLARYLLTGSAVQGTEEISDDDGRVLARLSANAKGTISIKIPPVYKQDDIDPQSILNAVVAALGKAMTANT